MCGDFDIKLYLKNNRKSTSDRDTLTNEVTSWNPFEIPGFSKNQFPSMCNNLFSSNFQDQSLSQIHTEISKFFQFRIRAMFLDYKLTNRGDLISR